MFVLLLSGFFFFKQKTAYDMRISDWTSDVCSSDLTDGGCHGAHGGRRQRPAGLGAVHEAPTNDEPGRVVRHPCRALRRPRRRRRLGRSPDRKSVVTGKSVSVRVDLGGRRIFIKRKQPQYHRPNLKPKTNRK